MVGAQSFIWRDKVTKLAQNRQLQAYVQERLEGAISDVHGKSKHLLPSMRHYLQTNLKESGDASFVNCGQYHRSCFDRLGVVIRVALMAWSGCGFVLRAGLMRPTQPISEPWVHPMRGN